MHTQNQHLICTQCGCCCTGAQPLGLHASCAQAETAPYLLYAVRSLLYRCAASGFAGLFVFGSVRRLWMEVSSVPTCEVTRQEWQGQWEMCNEQDTCCVRWVCEESLDGGQQRAHMCGDQTRMPRSLGNMERAGHAVYEMHTQNFKTVLVGGIPRNLEQLLCPLTFCWLFDELIGIT